MAYAVAMRFNIIGGVYSCTSRLEQQAAHVERRLQVEGCGIHRLLSAVEIQGAFEANAAGYGQFIEHIRGVLDEQFELPGGLDGFSGQPFRVRLDVNRGTGRQPE